ncbi:EAL domain-containing protein [Xylophilus sp. Kf1]|nr:EAL domain-containing protein [Xylophilus sp. Kf1]
MNRTRVIGQAICLALIGGLLPMLLIAYLSWLRTVDQEQARLQRYALRTLHNTTRSIDQGVQALQTLEAFRGVDCSPKHVNEMRRVTFNTRTVEEVGFFRDGRLRCTSWGLTTSMVAEAPPQDGSLGNGLDLTLKMGPQITGSDPVMALKRGRYNALIKSDRLADVILNEGVRIAILRGTTVVSELRAPAGDVLQQVAAAGVSGLDDRFLYAVTQADGWTVVVMEDRDAIGKRLVTELIWILPVGLFVGAFVVYLVVRLSRKRLSPLAELEIAVRRREFIVHYQPIISLKTGECVGAEALVRWCRPDGTLVRPDLFIPLAEQSGLILPITDQVMDGIGRDLAKVLGRYRSLHVSINLCASDMKSGRFLPHLEHVLATSGIANEQIWLEATERGFVEVDAARATLERARQLGFSIAIDDFGTGYSSLQYLQALPTDTLKIDKSFVDAIGTTSAPSSVTSHIIDMAKTLGLTLIAEGVETESQARYLREHQVEYAQGWLYAKALPAGDFVAFVQARNRAHGHPAP